MRNRVAGKSSIEKHPANCSFLGGAIYEEARYMNENLRGRREYENDHTANSGGVIIRLVVEESNDAIIFTELRKLKSETLQTRTELNSRLTNATIERNHWKNAFQQQKEFVERYVKHSHSYTVIIF